MNSNISKILEILSKEKINASLDRMIIFPYGSRVYKTNKENSDYDYILVIATRENVTGREIDTKDITLHLHTKEDFQSQLFLHKVPIMECYFQKDFNCDKIFDFKLDLQNLRKEFSAKASNSWVKCKKKLEIEREPYIGLKSLFHSLRILMFGIQIAKTGKIYDYSEANYIWKEIIESGRFDWHYYKEKYQPLYNKLHSEFKLLAPKD